MIAEYNVIHFKEYLPTVLNEEQMEYFQLKVKQTGYTKYNPKVNPKSIQSVGVAAFRFGHSQCTTNFKVQERPDYDSYTFDLKYRYFQTGDLWDGKVSLSQLFNDILINIS